jgi:hypothetical protein
MGSPCQGRARGASPPRAAASLLGRARPRTRDTRGGAHAQSTSERPHRIHAQDAGRQGVEALGPEGQERGPLWYPARWSPTCEKEMCRVAKEPVLENPNTIVVGISRDSTWSHRAWKKERAQVRPARRSAARRDQEVRHAAPRRGLHHQRGTVIVDKNGKVNFVQVQEKTPRSATGSRSRRAQEAEVAFSARRVPFAVALPEVRSRPRVLGGRTPFDVGGREREGRFGSRRSRPRSRPSGAASRRDRSAPAATGRPARSPCAARPRLREAPLRHQRLGELDALLDLGRRARRRVVLQPPIQTGSASRVRVRRMCAPS